MMCTGCFLADQVGQASLLSSQGTCGYADAGIIRLVFVCFRPKHLSRDGAVRVWSLLLFHRGRVVRLQIAQRILNSRANVREHRRHCVDAVAVAVRFVEHAAFPYAMNVA